MERYNTFSMDLFQINNIQKGKERKKERKREREKERNREI